MDNSRASNVRRATLLCVVDDIATATVLDPAIGFTTHKTKECAFTLSPAESKFLEKHKRLYADAIDSNSRVEFRPCSRYEQDGTVGAKVVAKTRIPRGQILKELSGQLCTTDQSFLRLRTIDYLTVFSELTKKLMLWLGPAAYVNHDCQSNAVIYSVSRNVACVKVTEDIEPGEEILVYYGAHYFGLDNEECLCRTCEDNGRGGFFNNTAAVEPVELLECAHCNARFSHKRLLRRHIVSHVL